MWTPDGGRGQPPPPPGSPPIPPTQLAPPTFNPPPPGYQPYPQPGYAPHPHPPPPAYTPGYPPYGQPPPGAGWPVWPGHGPPPPMANPNLAWPQAGASEDAGRPVQWRRLDSPATKRAAERELHHPSQRSFQWSGVGNADGSAGLDVVQINKALVEAGKRGNVQAVLASVAANGGVMNGVNVASAVRNVAEALDRCRAPRAAVLAVLHDARFHQQLMALVEAKMTEFTAWNVSQIVWAWGKLGYADLRPELRELLLSTFLWHLQNPPAQPTKRVKPQELKNVIHACATMRQPLSDTLLQDPDLKGCGALLQTSVREALRMMRDETAVFKPQEVANLMWAYARLEVQLSSPQLGAELAQAASTRVLSNLADTNGQHVANLLWACAKLEVAPEAADVHRLLHHLKNVQLEPQNTANAVYALAKLLNSGPAKDALRSQQLFPQLLESFAILEKAIVRMAPSAVPQDVGNSIWALGTLQRDNLVVAADETVQALHTAVVRLSPGDFKPQELKDTLWGFAHMGILPDMVVLERFEDIIIAQPDVFGPQELSNLVWAMGKLRADAFCPSPRLMSSLSNAILSKLDQFNTMNLLTALQGFASLPAQDVPSWKRLLAKMTGLAQGLLGGFTVHQVATCLWSLARLQADLPADGIAAFANRLDVVMEEDKSIRPQQLSNVMHAFAQLHERRKDVSEDNHFDNIGSARPKAGERYPSDQQLANVITCAQTTLQVCEPQNLSNLLWAMAKLGYLPSEQFMQWMIHKMVELVEEYTAQELVNILWSLAALSYDPPTRMFSELERVYQQMIAAGKFNCQDMANLLWGYATLGRTPAPTLLQSIAVEAVLKVEKFKHFELINVLWGFAMLGTDPGRELWVKGRERLNHLGADNFRVEGLCMLWHTNLLARARKWPCSLFFDSSSSLLASESDAPLGALGALGDACERQWRHVARLTIMSGLHNDVRQVLCRLPACGVVHVECGVGGEGEAPGVLKADIQVEWRGEPTIVEVDGPSHFTINTQRPLGKTLARNLLLLCRVPRVATVPFFDWDPLRASNGNLEEYLETTLDHARDHGSCQAPTQLPSTVPS